MVVTGSGQTGLWEDMVSRTGDVGSVRRLRENISYYAAHSTEAVQAWRERAEIDAWITWDIWHIPLRTEAKLIQVSKEYRIFRLCSAALTRRSQGKPAAARFVQFLTSAQASGIFASWGWMTPTQKAGSVTGGQEVKVVCDVGRSLTRNGQGRGLLEVKQLVAGYGAAGVERQGLQISAVVHGEAAQWLLKDSMYRRLKGTEEGNPCRSLAEGLLRCGVSLEVSAAEMKEHGWKEEDLLAGVRVVGGAHERMVELQQRGYAYLAF